MTPTPELKAAQNLTSADYLAQRVKEAYLSIGSENVADLESLYTPDIHFEDPSHAVQGKRSLMRYLHKQFSNLSKCSFKFHSSIASETDIFLTWTILGKLLFASEIRRIVWHLWEPSFRTICTGKAFTWSCRPRRSGVAILEGQVLSVDMLDLIWSPVVAASNRSWERGIFAT